MAFYESNVFATLILIAIPGLFGMYFFFISRQRSLGLCMLLLSAFVLRILMATLDPFLHDWDERFHALVAKHMIQFPFKPMLFSNHILPYDLGDWGYTHIWVHKQPLFLWQMALSMKIFGVSIFSMRLPSAIMGTIMVYLIYDISRMWVKNKDASFVAAFIAAFSYYPLEMISGWVSLDHNDLAFTFYLTCSIWALLCYIQKSQKVKWAVLVGVFIGLAILIKWLTALVIFGGWGLYVLLTPLRTQLRYYIHIAIGLVACCLVFVPWQIYIMTRFPKETALSYKNNLLHITEDLGHPGDAFTHLRFLETSYGYAVISMFVIGIIYLIGKNMYARAFTFSALSMIIVTFAFFSLIVATKMPALVYPVSALIIVISGAGLYGAVCSLASTLKKQSIREKLTPVLLLIFTIIVAYDTFKPAKISSDRGYDNAYRNKKLNNSNVFMQLGNDITGGRVVLNCRAYENIELMFHQDCLAYHFYPPACQLDSLQNAGYRFAAFDYPGELQELPDWIKEDTSILVLPYSMR